MIQTKEILEEFRSKPLKEAFWVCKQCTVGSRHTFYQAASNCEPGSFLADTEQLYKARATRVGRQHRNTELGLRFFSILVKEVRVLKEEARNNRCLDAAAATSSCEATSETSEIGTSSAKNSHFPCCIGTRFPVGLQAEQTPVVLLPRVVHSELEQLKTVENFFFYFLNLPEKVSKCNCQS